ncbi:aspartate aminotransferase family protein [Methyloligella sp. 2.7D]|uniref:aspartate aminotransferase family protein n=1 Tax=unclassified Methyloligella TaxID=2625955 RepID=UPI00157D44B7|nr:aspartate aminotransferase family protein [Methyloligella sp. GL2]QKP78090.1 aspartate aminotransferase family protein [Methyloligella sp. GL2]
MTDVFDEWESDVRGYSRIYPTVFKSASNARQTDEGGRSYIDFFAGAGVLNFGHNNERIKRAVIDFLEKDGLVHSLDMSTTVKRDFMQAFIDSIMKPRGMRYKLQFTGPTGTNAVEAALKLARRVTGRSTVIAFTHGFHGMTLGSLACTANSYFRNAAGVSLDNVQRLPFNRSLQEVSAAYADASSGYEPPAAVLVETIQAEGGVNVASAEWLRELQAFAQSRGALFIVDDIQASYGRTGSYFSFDGMDLDPDIICLAKGLGGLGTPIAMNMVKPEHDKHWSPGEHTGTFRGQGISFVAGREALRYFEDDSFMDEVKRKGAHIAERLNAIAASHSGRGFEVRGRGMMQAIDTQDGEIAKQIVARCFESGLLIGGCGPAGRVLKLIPPLTIPDEDLDEGLDILEASTQSLAEAA